MDYQTLISSAITASLFKQGSLCWGDDSSFNFQHDFSSIKLGGKIIAEMADLSSVLALVMPVLLLGVLGLVVHLRLMVFV